MKSDPITRDEIRDRLRNIMRDEEPSNVIQACKLAAQMEGYLDHGNTKPGAKDQVVAFPKTFGKVPLREGADNVDPEVAVG